MKNKRIEISLFIGLAGWIGFLVPGFIKNKLLNDLSTGESVNKVISFLLYYSSVISLIVCFSVGVWLLLNSANENAPVMRSTAWLVQVSLFCLLIIILAVGGAQQQ